MPVMERSGSAEPSRASSTSRPDADVIVVGAGPGGSAAAYHLARHGVSVLVLEKDEFPRDKVCGDGLTPRAVAQLRAMEVDLAAPGWRHSRGVRLLGGRARLELDWPELTSLPSFGVTRTRHDLDHLLVQRAIAAGATVRTRHPVTGPALDEADGRVIGVDASPPGAPATFRAPVVIAADGASGRLPVALGLTRRPDRPVGAAVRRYFHSAARHADRYLEGWLDLRRPDDPEPLLLPGYGWIFGLGEGRVNAGVGVLNTSRPGRVDCRALLRRWLGGVPPEWELTEEHADGPVRGAGLPMGMNRVPHYTRGLMLVGDSGGVINPFTGEGIAYALESGHLAAEVVTEALACRTATAREQALRRYPHLVRDRWGAYFRLGTAFVQAIGQPALLRLGVRYGLSRPLMARFGFKLLGNLTDPGGRDVADRLIHAMTRLAPAS
jgi:menaquinone-9 beta-reductase